MMTKKIVHMIDLSFHIEILLVNKFKLLKIPVFFSKFLKFQVLCCQNCQIPGFFRFPGKVATLGICAKFFVKIFDFIVLSVLLI